MADAGQKIFGVDAAEMPWSDACAYHEHGEGVCPLAEDDDGFPSPGFVRSPDTPLRRSARSVFMLSSFITGGSSTDGLASGPLE
jgi:hypothetical protein